MYQITHYHIPETWVMKFTTMRTSDLIQQISLSIVGRWDCSKKMTWSPTCSLLTVSDMKQCKILICHVDADSEVSYILANHIYMYLRFQCRLQCAFCRLGYETLQWVPTFWRNILYIFNKASCSMVCIVQKWKLYNFWTAVYAVHGKQIRKWVSITENQRNNKPDNCQDVVSNATFVISVLWLITAPFIRSRASGSTNKTEYCSLVVCISDSYPRVLY